MRLVFDNTTNTYSNAPGVETRVPGFGNTSSVEQLDPSVSATSYLAPLVQALVQAGLVRGVSIRAAPYDFRYTPQAMPQQISALAALIEDTYHLNNQQPVLLVAHSMGCRITLHLLHTQGAEWQAKYIKAYVPISGVWQGSVKLMRLMASGDNEKIPVVTALSVRGQQRTYQSNYWLLPQPGAWSENEALLVTASRSYSAFQYADFFRDLGMADGYQQWQLVANLSDPSIPPAVPTFCVYGTNVSTSDAFVYGPSQFPDTWPREVAGLGDGTVNARSLSRCAFWPLTKVFELPNVSHTDALSNSRTLDLLRGLIQ
eukprot:TRINITY_DN3779_c0_g1_i2.p1 TRINITY_DN3779_c0_g1~~TRINITY_DN3779_c0_g1_i2.p1  ORF type:complete len:315 (-),score=95.04 TRINITY_DN3779_c0_g1_i2:157-1101(-)